MDGLKGHHFHVKSDAERFDDAARSVALELIGELGRGSLLTETGETSRRFLVRTSDVRMLGEMLEVARMELRRLRPEETLDPRHRRSGIRRMVRVVELHQRARERLYPSERRLVDEQLQKGARIRHRSVSTLVVFAHRMKEQLVVVQEVAIQFVDLDASH